MSEITVAWLIRHTETNCNPNVWCTNIRDIQLTDNGKQRAIDIAEKVTRRPDLIITSPFLRSIDTAKPLHNKWPDVPCEQWSIQEFIYLSPGKYATKTIIDRNNAKKEYWQHASPTFCDGEDAESFLDFTGRLKSFHKQLLAQKGFVVVFGHGLFLKAFLL